MERPNRLGIGSIEHSATIAAHVDEADVRKHPQVLRDRRLLQPQGGHDLADGAFAPSEMGQDRPPAWLGHRIELSSPYWNVTARLGTALSTMMHGNP
jgi:hypothetical protein